MRIFILAMVLVFVGCQVSKKPTRNNVKDTPLEGYDCYFWINNDTLNHSIKGDTAMPRVTHKYVDIN